MATARQYLAWMPDEEEALRLGVEAHGDGNWSFILNDERFGKRLKMRDGNAMKEKWRKMSQAGDPKDTPARRQSEPAAAERAHPAGDAAAGPQSERARKRPVVPLRASEFIWAGEVDAHSQPATQCGIREEEDAEMESIIDPPLEANILFMEDALHKEEKIKALLKEDPSSNNGLSFKF